MGQNPTSVASSLILKIRENDKENLFSRIEIAKQAFINFWLSEQALRIELANIAKAKQRYGQGCAKKIKVLVEFLSANPTGPLPLHNGRGGIYGDTLANILKFSGYKVKTEYYINDAGNQIKILGASILA